MAKKVIVLSGASSVGKGKIKQLLLQDKELDLRSVISMTTRPKKENEVDGNDYYFVDYTYFAKAVKDKALYEYTEFNGYYYGTLKSEIDFWLKQGKNILVEVEAQGVGPLKLNIPEAVCFFVVPTSMEELEKLIHEKYNDDAASERMRINKAKMEMEIAPLFNNQITNDSPERAYEEIKEITLREWAKLEEDEK
ncbi:MAG: guanylate kinase [Oscillospiraceae bacterium]|nr:guanylate kinase [Oscillospiraceae bacterium]